jgi:hypothetical protein
VLLGPKPRSQVVESVPGCRLKAGDEIGECEFRTLFGKPLAVERRRLGMTVGIGNLIDMSGFLPPREF